METPRFKVLEQKFRAQKRCHPSHTHSQEHQSQGGSWQSNKLGHFEHSGSSDQWRAQQKRIPCGVLMGEAHTESGHHRDP